MRFPAHRGGHRAAVVPVRRAAPAGCGAGGGLLPDPGLGHRRHPSGRLRRHLRRTFELRRPGKEAGDLKGPSLRGLCRDPSVQLLCGLSGPVRLCTVHPAGRAALDDGIGAGTDALRLCGGGVPHGKEHRPCPHLCLGSRQSHCTPGAGPSGRCTVLRHAGTAPGRAPGRRGAAPRGGGRWSALGARGGWAGGRGALAVLWRYHAVACKQFGGITGDLAGWFLQKTEIWMLAALCACQWGGLL